MEFLGSLAGELITTLSSYLCPHISFLFYKKKVKVLSEKIKKLKTMKDETEANVNKAERRIEEINNVYNQWLTETRKILTDHSVVFESEEINSCFKGCCVRYSLGKKAHKMIGEVNELLKAQETYPKLSTPVLPQYIDMLPPTNFGAFNATKKAMEEVMKALNNDQWSIIGVHGMGGIGKTTLMKKIGSMVKEKYNMVVLVTVSPNQDVKKIQDEIAGELALKFGQESADSRAKMLVARLKNEDKVLIILDDIWKRLDLDKVGIPWGKDHMGCKVVLTTRHVDVCIMMATHANVRLACLSEEDAWTLFKKNAEVDDPSLIELATKVAEQCKGLPVALATLGRAMRGKKDKELWEIVHQQLLQSQIRQITGMDADVYEAIKLSYDFLRDEYKMYLLFCCLFPEDHKISMNELLRYMIGEGIIEESDIRQSRNTLHIAVTHLTSSHLLQKGDKDDFVTMHDIIRDVAINIATKEHGFIVMAGKGLEAWPGKEKLRRCKRLSLMGNELNKLPDHPDCQSLLTLTLSGCDSLKHIPESFFEGMTSLVNLDISYTPISSLPSSITLLKNLKTICLDGCSELRNASFIGKLTTLEVISLQKTSIDILPLNEILNFPNRKLLWKET